MEIISTYNQNQDFSGTLTRANPVLSILHFASQTENILSLTLTKVLLLLKPNYRLDSHPELWFMNVVFHSAKETWYRKY